MRFVVYGIGAVGARAARQLVGTTGLQDLVLIDQDLTVVEEAVASLGPPARTGAVSALRTDKRLARFLEVCADADAVVLTAEEDHLDLARAALENGLHVVSTSDDFETVEQLLKLDGIAASQERNLVAGAGFAPGLTCLLALHAATRLDVVDEIHVAKFGTGGPACARQHHRALRSDAIEWRNQRWERRRGGTGRELAWFPDPVGGLDCFLAALPDPLLLLPAFTGLVRCTARVSATRRDMGTKWLPMLRRPHPEGMVGAVRVEVRGWVGTSREAVVLGALDRPAVAAGTVAGIAAQWAVRGDYERSGAAGLARLVGDPVPMLNELAALGIRAAIFEGMTPVD